MSQTVKPFINNTHFGNDADLFTVLLENSVEVIILFDANGDLIYRNPAATAITGWTHEEVDANKVISSYIHPDDRERFSDNLKEAMEHPGKSVALRVRSIHKDGHYMYFEGSVRNLLHVDRIKAIVFNAKDIADAVLKEQQLQVYVEHSPAAIAMFDKEMRYMVVSRRWLADYKLEGQNVIGKSHYEVFPEVLDRWKEVHQRCLNGSTEKSEEDYYTKADGTLSWLRWEVTPWYNAGGDVGGIFLFTEDITDRKMAEEKVAASEKKYRTLVERVSDGFFSLDNDWNFVFVNNVAEKMFKRKAEELIGKNVWDVFPAAVNGPFYKAYYEAKATQKNSHLQAYSFAVNLHVHASIYPSDSGLSVYYRDMTEEQNAKSEVVKSEEKYRSLVERVSDGFIALDENWNFVYANSMAEKMFGKTAAEMIGNNIWEVFPAAVNGPFYTHYWQAMNLQQHVQFENYSTYAKKWLDTNVYPSSSGLSVYFKDITERIEAEAVAKSSEDIRKSIMGTALDAIICMEQDGTVSYWNAQAEKLFGWKDYEVMGKSLEKTIVHGRYKKGNQVAFKKYVSTGEGSFINKLVEITAVDKKGNEFPVELFIVEITDQQKPFFCAFIRDITERKQKEKELLRINTRLKDAQQIAHVGVVEVDYKAGVSQWSEEAMRIYGIEQGRKDISLEEWLSYIHPDDRNYVKENIGRISPGAKDLSFYHRIIRNGEIRYLLSTSRMEYDENNNPGNVYGVIHDITEIKKLELELLEQQAHEQHKITAAILKAEEKERNAIGQELHDNINQILTGIKLQLSRIRDISEETKVVVDMSTNYLNETINENRKIARELTMPDFKNTSLIDQLNCLTDYMLSQSVARKKIDTLCFDEEILSPEQKLTVYRVLQEQCTNITKYAKADTVNISLSTKKGICKMTVADNGVGMNAGKPSSGIGLRNIQSRLSLLQGTVSVQSSEGKGFALEISFPVEN